MKKVYIRFPTTGKIYFYNTGLDLDCNNEILAETDKVVEIGIVIKNPQTLVPIEEGGGKILRKLGEGDNMSVVIEFDSVGVKTLLVKYAPLKEV